MKHQLCKCINCGNIMIDKNPDEQPKFKTDNLVIVEMADIEIFKNGLTHDHFVGCPVCMTDIYLIDVTDISQLKTV